MSDRPSALRARFVFPVCGPPIADGAIEIDGQRIAAVGNVRGATDLGNVAIVPGFVNAHTHLEFSDLAEPLGTQGISLPDWIRLVIAKRRDAAEGGTDAVLAGLRESLACGTTTLAEIATQDWRASDLPAPVPTTVMFQEFIGPTPARAKTALAAAEAFLTARATRNQILQGLSPHAPYTVHPYLLAGLVALSCRYQVPLAMHLAETREELQLLQTESGPFRELLNALGAWDASKNARVGILGCLALLAQAPRALVIHGNYLNAAEIDFLADYRQTMSVVYCPRTHAYFAHAPYPLEQMLTAGLTVALGTDSRASNPDLSVLEEMKRAAANHPTIDRAKFLEMATLGGANALGLGASFGTLEPGKRANLAIIALDGSATPADPHELLLAPSARVVRTYLDGHWVD